MAYLTLTTKNQKIVMTEYGFFSGEITSVKTPEYYKAIGEVNKTYLPKKYHKDKYYTATDKVLRNLRAFMRSGCRNFELEEFKCNCGGKYCTGYPDVLKIDFLRNLQSLRDFYKEPISIRAGLRCRKYNEELTGSIVNSKHLSGKAADIYVNRISDTTKGRKQIINKWMTYPKANYAYQGTKNMGNSTHVDIE